MPSNSGKRAGVVTADMPAGPVGAKTEISKSLMANFSLGRLLAITLIDRIKQGASRYSL